MPTPQQHPEFDVSAEETEGPVVLPSRRLRLVSSASARLDPSSASTWYDIMPGQQAEAAVSPGVERDFDRLLQEWYLETIKSSNPDDITTRLSYYQIVALGEPVLPLIFRELARGTGFLFLALRAITRQNPVKPEHVGRRREMTEDWLNWGREHGYIKS